MKIKKFLFDNLTTLFYALIIAIIIRSLLFQPFYIPSSSMEPTLLVGDRLFVSKYTYGYSKHSFPFSPNISNNRFFSNVPKRGEVIVFKTPTDNRTDYIKRLIGLPGDEIQFIDGNLYLNNNQLTGEIPETICDIDIFWRLPNRWYVTVNQLCPPYPSCIESYMGVQDTTNCN